MREPYLRCGWTNACGAIGILPFSLARCAACVITMTAKCKEPVLPNIAGLHDLFIPKTNKCWFEVSSFQEIWRFGSPNRLDCFPAESKLVYYGEMLIYVSAHIHACMLAALEG